MANWEDVQNALKWTINRSNKVAESIRKDPGQIDLGTQIKRGNVAGFLNDETRNALGGFVNTIAPMDKIIGGAYQGDPTSVLMGGAQLGASWTGASALRPGAAATPTVSQIGGNQSKYDIARNIIKRLYGYDIGPKINSMPK